MSWNDRKIFQTVKFRVALWYAVLFALSAAISFLLVFIYLKNSMLRQTDHKLTSYADRVLYDYLTNNKFKRFDREVSLEKVPDEAMDAMQRRIPNLKPLLAFERGGRKGRALLDRASHRSGRRESRACAARRNADGRRRRGNAFL